MTAPGIELQRSPTGLRVRDRRADITPLVQGLAADKALKLLPTLLPICAGAQQIAAARALEAQRSICEAQSEHEQRERLLCREQALACAWRLLIDWPRALGRAPATPQLGRLRRMRDRELSLALLQLLPDLEHVQSVEDLLSWCYGHHCVGAEIACTALADSRTGPALSLLSGEPLWQEALEQLQRPPSERVGAINSSSFVVGPLAMGRHPLIDALAPRSDMPARARLLLAMLLDTVAVAYALDGAPLPCPTTQRQLHRGAAGRADTSRGPLFHFVSLDDQSRVQAWRVLAPTDWHVARDGLLQQLLHTEDADPQPAISVNAVDPCAPWRICEETSDEVADA